MSGVPFPIAVLLAEVSQRGIVLRAVGNKLRYHPAALMTPDLAERLRAHKIELLALLSDRTGTETQVGGAADEGFRAGPGAPGDSSLPLRNCTLTERTFLERCPQHVLELVEEAKTAFAPLGGVTVVGVRPFKSAARDEAARLIREARRLREQERAAALRDAWRERVFICALGSGIAMEKAEAVALEEMRALPRPRIAAHRLASPCRARATNVALDGPGCPPPGADLGPPTHDLAKIPVICRVRVANSDTAGTGTETPTASGKNAGFSTSATAVKQPAEDRAGFVPFRSGAPDNYPWEILKCRQPDGDGLLGWAVLADDCYLEIVRERGVVKTLTVPSIFNSGQLRERRR